VLDLDRTQIMEHAPEDCSPLLRSVLYHYANTPGPERSAFVAKLVQVRDRFLAEGALETLPSNKQIYILRQAGWVSLLADEPLRQAEAYFAASSNLLPADLRDCHLVVYVQNALLYLTRLAERQYREAQALRLSPTWQRHPHSHWKTVTHLLRHVAGVRQHCADLLRNPGPNLDATALSELGELLDQGLIGVSLVPPSDPGFARLRKQIAALPGKKDRSLASDTKVGLSVILLSMAAVCCTCWLLWGLMHP
jgi:hypothetical protein